MALMVTGQRVEKLIGEIDTCRRDVSALVYWANQDAAPKIRRMDKAAAVVRELADRIGTLELNDTGSTSLVAELLVTVRQLESHARVTVGRLESLEQALVEWNTAAQPFADRLERLEAGGARLEAVEVEQRGMRATLIDQRSALEDHERRLWQECEARVALEDRVSRLSEKLPE